MEVAEYEDGNLEFIGVIKKEPYVSMIRESEAFQLKATTFICNVYIAEKNSMMNRNFNATWLKNI